MKPWTFSLPLVAPRVGLPSSRPLARAQATAREAAGPLRAHPTNGRRFTDGSLKAVYLTGSQTWATRQAIEGDAVLDLRPVSGARGSGGGKS